MFTDAARVRLKRALLDFQLSLDQFSDKTINLSDQCLELDEEGLQPLLVHSEFTEMGLIDALAVLQRLQSFIKPQLIDVRLVDWLRAPDG